MKPWFGEYCCGLSTPTLKTIWINNVYFNPSPMGHRFPMCQIGAFRPLRRDCTRLRHRRMSWVVSKGRASIFIRLIEAGTAVKSYVLLPLKKNTRPFDTICDILWALRLVQSLIKGRNAPIWHIENRRVKLDQKFSEQNLVNKIWNYWALRGSRAHSEALGPD